MGRRLEGCSALELGSIGKSPSLLFHSLSPRDCHADLTDHTSQWVTHSSATAYRSQNNGACGFAYDYTEASTNLPGLFGAVGKTGSLENLNALEGLWNLSVYDRVEHVI